MKRERKILQEVPEKHVVVALDYDRVVVHDTEMALSEARLSVDIAKQLAFATCVSSGEFDVAGRAMYRLLTPAEVATRATNIASALYSEWRERGWIVSVPVKQEYPDVPPQPEPSQS